MVITVDLQTYLPIEFTLCQLNYIIKCLPRTLPKMEETDNG